MVARSVWTSPKIVGQVQAREPEDPALVLPVKGVPAGSRRGHLARVASIVPVNGALMTAPAVNAGLIGRLPPARGLTHDRPGRGDVKGSTPAHRRAAMEVALATVRRVETLVLPGNRAGNRAENPAGTSAAPPGMAGGMGIVLPRTSAIGRLAKVAGSTVPQGGVANAASTGHVPGGHEVMDRVRAAGASATAHRLRAAGASATGLPARVAASTDRGRAAALAGSGRAGRAAGVVVGALAARRAAGFPPTTRSGMMIAHGGVKTRKRRRSTTRP